MKLVRYFHKKNRSEQLGIEEEERIIQIQPLAAKVGINVPSSMDEILEHCEEEAQKLTLLLKKARDEQINLVDYSLDPETIRYLPVVKSPEKILCIGLNYLQHAREINGEIPTNPILFSKFNNSLAGHNQDIPLPAIATKVDYEAELVIVMGKEAYQISKESAYEHILGYTIGNDLSDRSLQFKTEQWLIGKTLNYFAPIGPVIVTKETLADPNNLNISLKRNENTVQSDNTNDMIFPVDYLVSYLSQHMTLKPGDLIFTGTPSGVIAGKKKDEQQWLKPTDELEVTIEGIGTLKNRLT